MEENCTIRFDHENELGNYSRNLNWLDSYKYNGFF